ncbi:MAG: roadblock/LC7 domain-containing protein [Microthrixaceae bacterium]|nr:roadblock/LC7 domain-containing protein [Acidimicrobiales bacterium]MCB9402911.1 roadblock/LC7 domain-containing protein [Microthrixaceae bacterium]
MSLEADAQEFNWLLNNFVTSTSGVSDAVAVSSDGLLMARSSTLDDAGADQLSAIISGFVSLGDGTTRCFEFEELYQIIVAMKGGNLIVTSMGQAGCLGVVAEPRSDMGNISYQMTLLVERAGRMLTPELIDELKNLVMVR